MTDTKPIVYHQDNSLTAFFTGALIGVAATLMVTTKEGRDTASKLSSVLQDLSQELGKELQHTLENLPDLVDDIKNEYHQSVQSSRPVSTKQVTSGFFPRLHRATSSFTKSGKELK